METTFEWDDRKAEENIKNHGVSFFEARSAFDDSLSVTIKDEIHSVGEQRFITVGESSRQRLLVIVHLQEGDLIRIISARSATRRERKTYEAGKTH